MTAVEREEACLSAIVELVRWTGEQIGKCDNILDLSAWFGGICGLGELWDEQDSYLDKWQEAWKCLNLPLDEEIRLKLPNVARVQNRSLEKMKTIKAQYQL